MNNDFVSLKHLAAELGMDRSYIRKYVLSSGMTPHKRRTPDSSMQLALALTAEEAEAIRAKRAEEGFLGSQRPVVKEYGVFYLIRLVPELDPRRIKVGFTDDVAHRMMQHKTAAPTATLVQAWACKRSWEVAVIDCLSVECKLILNEVYECEDIPGLLDRANRLFSLMPGPEQKSELSDHSPCNT